MNYELSFIISLVPGNLMGLNACSVSYEGGGGGARNLGVVFCPNSCVINQCDYYLSNQSHDWSVEKKVWIFRPLSKNGRKRHFRSVLTCMKASFYIEISYLQNNV